MINIKFESDDLKEALESADKGDYSPLKTLCRKEVDNFEEYLKTHPNYSDGLARFERMAVEGYLYQKLRGHFD